MLQANMGLDQHSSKKASMWPMQAEQRLKNGMRK